jgi:hypothetical protein
MDARQRRFLDGLERVQEHRARGPLQLGDNYVNHLSLQQQQDPISLGIAGAVTAGLVEVGVPLALAQFGGFVVQAATIAAVGVGINYSSRALMGGDQ